MSPTVDDLVAHVAPITDDEVAALPLECLAGELCAAITAQPRGLPRGCRPRARIAGALALAACAGLMLALAGTGADRMAGRAWAAEAVRVANAVPRLLIDEPRWNVVRADEFGVRDGEMTFADGAQRYDLKWIKSPAGVRLEQGHGKDPSARRVARTTVLGHRALVYRYAFGDSPGYLTGVWKQGGYMLELRSAADDPDTDPFIALLHRLRIASVDEWLSAMPPSVVVPIDQAKVVRAMLAGIPLPAGFDTRRLADGAIHDRYQLGARVAGAATCAWIGQWVKARRMGDALAASRAVAAMKTSHDWAILREMDAAGDYPEVVWKFADAIAGPGTVLGGRVLTVEESYRASFGCGGGPV